LIATQAGWHGIELFDGDGLMDMTQTNRCQLRPVLRGHEGGLSHAARLSSRFAEDGNVQCAQVDYIYTEPHLNKLAWKIYKREWNPHGHENIDFCFPEMALQGVAMATFR